MTPKAIERECVARAKDSYGGCLGINSKGEKVDSRIINEVVLNKTAARPKNVFVKTNGCEFLFWEYIHVKQMLESYGIPIKIINMSKYRQKAGLEPYSQEEKEKFHADVVRYLNAQDGLETIYTKDEYGRPYDYQRHVLPARTPAETIAFLNGYKQDILEKAGYPKDVKEHMEKVIDGMLEYAENKQREAQPKKRGRKPKTEQMH